MIIDIKHYIRKNWIFLVTVNAILLASAVVGIIGASNTDYVTLAESGKTPIFVFIESGKSAFIGNIFLSTILVFGLLCGTRWFAFFKKWGILLIAVKLMQAFRQLWWVLLYFGMKSCLPIVVILLLEILVCLLLEIVYLLNVSEELATSAPFCEEFFSLSVVPFVMALIFNIVLCLAYSFLGALL